MRPLFCLLTLVLSMSTAFATHILGGYIRATPVANQPNTYQITVTMYYDLTLGGGSAAAAATGIKVCFGDGSPAQQVARMALNPLSGNPAVGLNEYAATHTYVGSGVYKLLASAVNRTDNVRNIPGSQQAFSLQTTLMTGSVVNSTPVMVSPGTGFQVALNQPVTLLLAATDTEGDSLAYSLALPLSDNYPNVNAGQGIVCAALTPVAGYQFPNDLLKIGSYRLNPTTGLLTWAVPSDQGRYAVALKVAEWRKGLLISETQQEITLIVIDKGGTPVIPPAYEPAQLALIMAIADTNSEVIRLVVSPNPLTNNLLRVDVAMNQAEPVTLQLLDSQGRIHKILHLTQPLPQQFDMTGQPAGLYFIRAESGGRQIVKKVLKE